MARLKYKLNDDNITQVTTKLGLITIDLSKAICFPKGIVGFPNLHYYCCVEVPENKLPGALILQSIDDERAGFIVLPLAEKFYKGESALIKYEDVLDAAESYGIKEDSINIMVIARVARHDDQFYLTINLKAPIILDLQERLAYQHIFVKNTYPLNYTLNS